MRQEFIAAFTRLYPFYSGCGSLANSGLLRRLAGDGRGQLRWVRMGGGIRLRVPLDDHVGRAVFFAGDLDPKVTWICKRLVRAGDVVLDIGANLGCITAVMSRLVGDRGEVHAFEPNPRVGDLLAESLATSGVRNVHLHRVALGAEDGELELHVPHGNAGSASLLRFTHADNAAYTAKVPVRRLGSVLAGTGGTPKHVRFVKLDVEGYEPQVIDGCRSYFEEVGLPDAILFELNDPVTPLARHPTISRLTEMGYAFFSIPRALLRPQLQPFDANAPDPPAGHDFLAVPADHRLREISVLIGTETSGAVGANTGG